MKANKLLIDTNNHAITLLLIFCMMILLNGCSEDSAVIYNPGNTATDITNVILENTSANCADYVDSYQSSVLDVNRSITFEGNLTISVNAGKCVFSSNDIPNHNFNDGAASFVSNVSEQALVFEVTTNPVAAANTTALSLGTDNAIFLNGVKLDILAAACYGVGDGKIGCNDINQPWRYDPMSPLNDFRTDSHNAHTQPDGAYHYHGSPQALFDPATVVVSPVIGFAADGFPIYGSYFYDGSKVRKATSSYQLKTGSRGVMSATNPGGNYDGTYRDDYQYNSGSGDLDECNGMNVDGVYGYYIADSYPWVLACFKGTPDNSFNK